MAWLKTSHAHRQNHEADDYCLDVVKAVNSQIVGPFEFLDG
jgi:hypothetical protein